MHRLLGFLAGAALACLSFASPPLCPDVAVARPRPSCAARALAHLRALSPDGFAIYEQLGDPAYFKSWLDCADAQFDLSTAVHESTHRITAETDAFPLVGGGEVRRPHEVSGFFPPARIAERFETDDLVSIYLRPGRASSATDFLYLLDEFNAYSHDLDAATALKDLTLANEAVDHRDGLAAMMAFVAIYAETARQSEPRTWRGLQTPQVSGTIRDLWGRAERVMAASCGVPNFGTRDIYYIRTSCAAEAQSALAQILRRAPICPAACLRLAADAGLGPDVPAFTEPSARVAWRRKTGRRQRR